MMLAATRKEYNDSIDYCIQVEWLWCLLKVKPINVNGRVLPFYFLNMFVSQLSLSYIYVITTKKKSFHSYITLIEFISAVVRVGAYYI